jgi:hypothetical protein
MQAKLAQFQQCITHPDTIRPTCLIAQSGDNLHQAMVQLIRFSKRSVDLQKRSQTIAHTTADYHHYIAKCSYIDYPSLHCMEPRTDARPATTVSGGAALVTCTTQYCAQLFHGSSTGRKHGCDFHIHSICLKNHNTDHGLLIPGCLLEWYYTVE